MHRSIIYKGFTNSKLGEIERIHNKINNKK
jgi:hypothetical protein